MTFATTTINLFCIISGEKLSNAFLLENILPSIKVGKLKEYILNRENKLEHLDPDNLKLWVVDIPIEEGTAEKIILPDDFDDKKSMMEGEISQYFQLGASESTAHIIVEISGEDQLQDTLTSKKARFQGQWREYIASDGNMVRLPPDLIELLRRDDFKPAPRTDFAQFVGNLQPGDQIGTPSLGETPKPFGIFGVEPKLVITEQMLEMWCEIQNGTPDENLPCRRVLAGPVGIGKSYLAYFLAARGYAEGMLTLYIADARILDRQEIESAKALVARFLSLNKDILTASELELLVSNYDGIKHVYIESVFAIFRLLKQEERKTLLVVDEHKMLFQYKPYVPQRYNFLDHLSDLDSWEEKYKGSSVILTGTTHTNYEVSVLPRDLQKSSVVFIGPFSETVFSKLLEQFPRLNQEELISPVCKYTNRVPRELAFMDRDIRDTEGPITEEMVKVWSVNRSRVFRAIAWEYRESLEQRLRSKFYGVLDESFRERRSDISFKNDLVDIGLGYRLKDGEGGKTRLHILSPSAQAGILGVFGQMRM
ncbi:hypothetical protein BGZ76_002041 [Entomortierella beljakovae]|nr:hypothetical protein BGZ76_002041 [Entomortierella beljakovae]